VYDITRISSTFSRCLTVIIQVGHISLRQTRLCRLSGRTTPCFV